MRLLRCECVVLGVLTLMLSVGPSPRAREGKSGVVGRVVDRSGDPIPGAIVEFRCGAPPVVRTTRTDENGRFQSPAGVAGACSVEARLPAVDRSVKVDRQIAAGAIEEIRLALDLDVLNEKVAVSGSPIRDSVESREIREGFYQDAGEALSRVDGVHRIRKGGIANDIVVRGFKGDNLNVLIDGHRIYGACPNRMDPPAFHVDFAEVERIEMTKGPFDLLHAGGLGGTVNIVTREPETGFRLGVQASANTYSDFAPSIAVSYGAPRWNVSGGYAHRRADVYRDGDGVRFTDRANYEPRAAGEPAFRIGTWWVGAGAAPAAGHSLKVQMTQQRGNAQLYPYLLMDAEYDDAKRISVTYEAQAPFRGVERVEASASWAAVDHLMTDALRSSSREMPLAYSMSTLAASSVVSETLRFRLPLGLSVGVEAYRRHWDATARLAGPRRDYRAQASLPHADNRNVGLFAQYDGRLTPRWKLQASVRIDRTSSEADPARANTDLYFAYHGTREVSRTDTEPSAAVFATWDASSAWQLFAGVGRTTRSPDPLERYFALTRKDADWVGNPDLVPSKNTEVDVGVRFKGQTMSLDVSGYHSWLTDFIVVANTARKNAVPGVRNLKARSYANNDARVWGGEASARWAPGRGVLVSAGLSYVRGLQDLDLSRNIADRDLPEMPPLSARATLRYDTGKWFFETEGVAHAAQDWVDSDLDERRTPGWGIANLRGGLLFDRFSIFVALDNVFDRFHREHLSYQRDPFRSGVLVPEPGRTFAVSLLYRY